MLNNKRQPKPPFDNIKKYFINSKREYSPQRYKNVETSKRGFYIFFGVLYFFEFLPPSIFASNIIHHFFFIDMDKNYLHEVLTDLWNNTSLAAMGALANALYQPESTAMQTVKIAIGNVIFGTLTNLAIRGYAELSPVIPAITILGGMYGFQFFSYLKEKAKNPVRFFRKIKNEDEDED